MARPIQAQQSRDVVSFIRSQFEDEAYKIIKSDDIIFEFENYIQREIAKNTFCLNDKDLDFAMIPNKEEYSLLEVIDTPQFILRLNEVSVVAPDKITTVPLTKLTDEMYNIYKRDNLIQSPKYYNFDKNRLYILRPYGVNGYTVKLRYSRLPGENERCSYENGTVLPFQYADYLKYGTAMMIAQKYPEWRNRIAFFESIYSRYKIDYIKPITTNNEKIDFREL